MTNHRLTWLRQHLEGQFPLASESIKTEQALVLSAHVMGWCARNLGESWDFSVTTLFFLKLLKSYRCYQLRWIWDLQMFTIVLYQASHLRTGHLRPKNFKAEIWKGPSFKNDGKGQRPVFLGPLEIVWFTSLLVSIFVSLILSSIWLMFSIVAPGVKDSLVTFSFIS